MNTFLDGGPYALANDALSLLESALDDSFNYRTEFIGETGLSDWREIYSYRHARNIYQLGKESLFLRNEGYWHAISLILRAQLESLFCLGAAVEEEQFATVKANVEIEHYMKHSAKHLAPETLKQLEELKESILSSNGSPVVEKRPSIQQVADKANLGFMYDWYRHLSGQIHGDVAGLVTSERGGTEGYQLNLLSAIPAIATGFLVRVAPTSNPQGFVDEAVSILERNLKLSQDDVFSTLDSQEEQRKSLMFK